MYRISILAVSLLLLANSSSAQSDLFVITTDFSTGSTAFLAANAAEAEVNLLGIHSDAVGHYHDGRVYIVNRLGQDNILVLDAMDLRTPLTQFSVGNGANPHDIEIVAPDKAYVTRYDTASLLIVNPQDGAELGQIDLSAFADADGLPEVSQIVRVGDRLYLSCQRLDRNGGWGPADVSYLIVVDLATDSLVDVDPDAEGVQGIALSAANPNSMAVVGEQIAVGVVVNFGDRSGGVEIVDTTTNRSLGLAVSEEDLGGDITSMVLVDQNRGYAVVADENFANGVRPFELSSGTVGVPLENISGGFIPSLAVDGGPLDRRRPRLFLRPGQRGTQILRCGHRSVPARSHRYRPAAVEYRGPGRCDRSHGYGGDRRQLAAGICLGGGLSQSLQCLGADSLCGLGGQHLGRIDRPRRVGPHRPHADRRYDGRRETRAPLGRSQCRR